MPKRTKQKQKQKQRQSLTNIVKIAIGNRRREKRERESRQPIIQSIQRQPQIIYQSPLIPNQQTSSSLYDRELMKTRLDLLQSQLEGKVLEAVNKLQQPTFKSGSSMTGPTAEELLGPKLGGDSKPSGEQLFGLGLEMPPKYEAPVFESGEPYQFGEEIPSFKPQTPMGLTASTLSTEFSPFKPPSSLGAGSPTPATTTTIGVEAMKSFLKANLDKIPSTLKKGGYSEKDLDGLQANRLQKIYNATQTAIAQKKGS